MIRIALKHWIYELCIDKFFERIYKNFSIFDKSLQNYKIGQYIPHLQITREDNVPIDLYKCRVVYRNGNKEVLECYDTKLPSLIFIRNNSIVMMKAKVESLDTSYKDMFPDE